MQFALTSGNPESMLLQTHKNSAGISFFNRAVSGPQSILWFIWGSWCGSLKMLKNLCLYYENTRPVVPKYP
uniref:Uncharacterized protein n=1 Tax=Moniliophthora roreri TaxID=221103 RepID=A0A0W0G2Y5_MONRR